MQPRLFAFAKVVGGPALWSRSGRPIVRSCNIQYVCKSCQNRFSTSPPLRWLGQSSKPAAKTTRKDRGYKSRLLIYDAGDFRTTWISFWKAMALLQFGTTLVFGVPPLWNNENQPNPDVRKFQAVLVGVLGTIPTLTLAYVTAPFVHQVFLQIPDYARRSRHDLMHFARTLSAKPKATADTKLEFVTLRIFPFRKHTTTFLHELRALPPMQMRLANIEIPKTEQWLQRQREKGIFKKMGEVLKEPRLKFYIKEGRIYTMKTGVSGVWEEVAKRIHEQTTAEKEEAKMATTETRKLSLLRRPVKVVRPIEKDRIKRQTSRPVHK